MQAIDKHYSTNKVIITSYIQVHFTTIIYGYSIQVHKVQYSGIPDIYPNNLTNYCDKL